MLRSVSEFSEACETARFDHRPDSWAVGFVPTMGALHAGHRSLLERACSDCRFVAASIFVNPLQFDDSADLDAYPRTLEADLGVLEAAGAHAVFVPSTSEMYPDGAAIGRSSTTVHVSGLTDMLEGQFRPGHFDGVATVVAKLFSISGRCHAYFGEKDFQQVAVVRRMVRDLRLPVEIVACGTVRESDGLAVSSRNARLGPEDRKIAPVLHRALVAGAQAVSEGEDLPDRVRDKMLEVLSTEPAVEPEYAEVVDPVHLQRPDRISAEVRLLIAAKVGSVRLIDNVAAKAPALPDRAGTDGGSS